MQPRHLNVRSCRRNSGNPHRLHAFDILIMALNANHSEKRVYVIMLDLCCIRAPLVEEEIHVLIIDAVTANVCEKSILVGRNSLIHVEPHTFPTTRPPPSARHVAKEG